MNILYRRPSGLSPGSTPATRTLVACGLTAAVLALGAAWPALAAPPMWEVTDEDSRMVLYGTVHVLRPETAWRTEAMRAALQGAEEVWFEIDPVKIGDPALIAPLMPLMLDSGGSLSSRLPPDLYQRFSAAARQLGTPPEQLEPFKPAIAAMMLAAQAMVRAGYSPDSGVDKVLRGDVPDGSVRQLETLEGQIRLFTDLPDEAQIVLLAASLDDVTDPGFLDRLVTAWTDGDLQELEEAYLADLLADSRQAYDLFVRERNLAWADRLAEEMEKAGTDFVAVGALHLVGPDGLPTLLRDRGYTVRQIE